MNINNFDKDDWKQLSEREKISFAVEMLSTAKTITIAMNTTGEQPPWNVMTLQSIIQQLGDAPEQVLVQYIDEEILIPIPQDIDVLADIIQKVLTNDTQITETEVIIGKSVTADMEKYYLNNIQSAENIQFVMETILAGYNIINDNNGEIYLNDFIEAVTQILLNILKETIPAYANMSIPAIMNRQSEIYASISDKIDEVDIFASPEEMILYAMQSLQLMALAMKIQITRKMSDNIAKRYNLHIDIDREDQDNTDNDNIEKENNTNDDIRNLLKS